MSKRAESTMSPVYSDSGQDLDARVASLLTALNMEEKISLCAGQGFWTTKAVPRLGILPFKMTDGPRGVAFHSSFRRCTAFPSGIREWKAEPR